MKRTIFLFMAFCSGLVFSQDFTEFNKLVAFDRDTTDRFGYSVDISENYAIVGAYADDFGDFGPNMGSAYIFEKTGVSDWVLVQKINNSDQDAYDRFGWSVAIDGDYAVVGAYAEDHNTVDGEPLSKAGSAYIYERDADGTWNEIQKIIASDREIDDEFGWSVAISGSTIAVGAHFESHDEIGENYIYHTGSVYIFERMLDETWVETQKLVASDRSADVDFPDGGGAEDYSDQFGGAISLANDYLIIGAHHHDYNAVGTTPLNQAGAAYIFERTAGIWNEVQKLDASDRSFDDRFGWSVAIEGDLAIVTAPTEDHSATGTDIMTNSGSVYAFVRDADGEWNPTQKIVASDRSPGDRFGWDVSIEGTICLIGSYANNTNETDTDPLPDAGAAYTYLYSGSWTEHNKLVASDRQADDQLGRSVSISSSGLILGANQQDFNSIGESEISNSGAIYFYSQEDCSPLSSAQELTLCAGHVVTVGPYTHSETGVYEDVIAAVSGCDSTVTTTLTIIAAPVSEQDIDICFGYGYTIGASTHTETGTYSDTISNAAGCDSIVITNLTVTPENAVEQDITICWGESYTIGASTYTEPGSYTDVLTSWILCDSTITTNLSIQLPIDNSISQSMNYLTANENDAAYQWIKCSPYVILEGATSQSYTTPETGQYAVIVTKGACIDTSACVYVDMLSAASYEALNPISVYPNPGSGIFTLNYQAKSDHYQAIITDPLGKIVHEVTLKNYSEQIDLHNLTPGIYVLMVKEDDSTRSILLQIQ